MVTPLSEETRNSNLVVMLMGGSFMKPDSETTQPTFILDIPLFSIGSTDVTGSLLITAAAIVIVALVLSLWLKWLLMRAFEKRGFHDDKTIRSYATVLQLLVIVIGIGIALHTIGIYMTGVFAAGGVFALATGFAFKDIAENFMAGVMVRIEHTIKLGDVIEIDGEMVKVTRLGARSTTARTLQDEDILIPNSNLIKSFVTNYTLRDPLSRLSVQIEVPSSADLDQVRTSLEETSNNIVWRARDRKPEVFLESRNNSTATYTVAVWIDDPWKSPQLRSDLNEAMWKSLNIEPVTPG
jgi:small-conductance mechanosensitive channel